LPYLVEAADGTVLQTSEDRLPRAESTARVYASEKGVETRVTEWRETEQGYKSREVWCASDYPATVRFPARAELPSRVRPRWGTCKSADMSALKRAL